MKRVLLVFGTRPEAIKMAPIVHKLSDQGNGIEPIICVSAQHREMLDQVLTLFGIEPDYDLNLMRRGQTPAQVAGTIMHELPPLLEKIKPDFMLVQGDTITTFSAAMCAFLAHIPVGHVEAGLRTGNPDHPFPEEINRRLTTQLSKLHFAPTTTALDALVAENVKADSIIVTGNTVIDALLRTVSPDHVFSEELLKNLDSSRRHILVTTHRRESFGEPLRNICTAILEIVRRKSDVDVIIPVHPNPAVSAVVSELLHNTDRVHLVPPLEYRDFVNLMARCSLILTDSGGVQEEAPSLDVPVLVLRETTERQEGIAAGASKLVGTSTDKIVSEALSLLSDSTAHAQMSAAKNPYGDGSASDRIVAMIIEFLQRSR